MTRNDAIIITRTDQTRLRELITRILNEGGPDVAHLHDLGEEIERATVVEPEKVPTDVVTMNSRVRIVDAENGEVSEFTLVYPPEADVDAGRISVLAPIGTALLGYRAGDVVEWSFPAGRRTFRIEKVLFQPEATGEFQL